MKTIIITSILLLCSNLVYSQKKGFSYDFYGFIRGDLFYNTRKSVAPVDGNFYLYPLDNSYDAKGNDLNEVTNGTFYTFTTRLGIKIKGPRIGKARTSANIETDFGGAGKKIALLRLRKAYVAFDWKKHHLLLGQTWHPLFGKVFPDILNLSTGAPFQPFNRSPQIRYQYSEHGFTITASALWQMQYASNGPEGVSTSYQKNGCIPEFYLGADWKTDSGWLFGAGAHVLSIVPRLQTTWNDKEYKVNERMTSTSYEAHLNFKKDGIYVAGKTLLASALDHSALLGGYGIKSIDPHNGEQKYTAFHHSTSWMNITYGKEWKPTLFVGYTKNLGTSHKLVSVDKLYGSGLNIDQLMTANLGLSFNQAHWQIGIEGSLCTAWYGNVDTQDGKVENTHSVSNLRILGLIMYHF